MRILLATDGSEFAQEAAAKCGEIAGRAEKSVIKIITVIDNFIPMATEPFISPEEFLESVEKEMQENAENKILEAVKIIRNVNENIKIEKEILMGSAKKMIIKTAEKWEADLIVVGSHGYGFIERLLLGSVSDAVIHHSPCSVLVVRSSKK